MTLVERTETFIKCDGCGISFDTTDIPPTWTAFGGFHVCGDCILDRDVLVRVGLAMTADASDTWTDALHRLFAAISVL